MRPLRASALALLAATLLAGCGGLPQRPAPVTEAREAPTSPSAPAADPAGERRALAEAVAAAALQLRGVRYRFGGDSPQQGFDCSGLVRWVYRAHGVQLPRVAADMAAVLPAVDGQQPAVGDLLFFNTRGARYSHVALYIGAGRFVHAPSARTGRVVVSAIDRPYWRRRLTGVRRPLAGVATSL